MAEGARLESVYTATYPGFESPPHRHILRRARTQVRAFFSHVAQPGGDEKPGPGFDYWRSQLDRLRAQRTDCPQGERSESIPASPPYFKKSSYASTGFFSHVAQPGGDEKPGPGFDYWRSQLDRLRAQRTDCPQGERSESIPASPPYFKKSSYASTGFFFACCICRMRCKHLIRLRMTNNL